LTQSIYYETITKMRFAKAIGEILY